MQRAREKLMPSKRAERERKSRCAGGQSPFLFHTPIRRARLNKLISTAGREGWQKEMGKLLSPSLFAMAGQKICRQIFSREAKFELEMRAKCTFCLCANGPVLRQAEWICQHTVSLSCRFFCRTLSLWKAQAEEAPTCRISIWQLGIFFSNCRSS